MKITDPLTGKSIDWVGCPESPLYTIPLSACTDDRAVARWTFPWESPDLAEKLGTDYWVAGKTWQCGGFGLWRFAADLSFTKAYYRRVYVGTSYASNQIGPIHFGTAIHASATEIEYTVTDGAQGAGTVRLVKIAPADTLVTDIGALNFEGAQINGSNLTQAYMVKSCITADGNRVIGGCWKTADTKYHAAVMTSAAFATTGWTVQPLVYRDGIQNMAVHQIATEGTGGNTVIVVAFGGGCGDAQLGIAYTVNNGANWFFLTPGGAVAVPVGGMSHTDFDAANYWIVADTDSTCKSAFRIIVTGTTAWMSVAVSTRTYVHWGFTGNTNHYLYKLDLATPACTVYGPFFPAHTGWGAGLDIQWNGSNIRCVRAIPKIGTNPDANYSDYPYGGPTLGVYDYTVAAPTVEPVLAKTIALDGTGSPYEYVDRVWGIYPGHEEGYGDHQVFLGCRWVRGASGMLAVNVGDQRVSDVNLVFHMSRIKIISGT